MLLLVALTLAATIQEVDVSLSKVQQHDDFVWTSNWAEISIVEEEIEEVLAQVLRYTPGPHA
tara:strand:+ start:108 stop:293 length:186 start_codon:yes stop_codon:yes gene_type:complete